MAIWTDEQVKSLNEFQRNGQFHPFTCGNNRNDKAHLDYQKEHNDPDNGLLVATPDGWICPVPECGYTQDWAYGGMADGSLNQIAQKNKEMWDTMLNTGKFGTDE